MSGIPSVGDILMLSQQAWKVGRAFTAGGKDAPTDFSGVESQVNGLAKALKSLAETLFADGEGSLSKNLSKEAQFSVATILRSCQRCIHNLDALIDQYQVIKKQRIEGGFAIDRTWTDLVLSSYQTIPWTTEGGAIQDLRNILEMQSRIVTLIMQALSGKTLTLIENVMIPVAESVKGMHQGTMTTGYHLEEVNRIINEAASRAPALRPTHELESRPPSSINLNPSYRNSPIEDLFSDYEQLPRQLAPRSPPPTSPLPRTPLVSIPRSPSTSAPPTASTSPIRNRISDFSFSGSTVRYSGSSYTSSDGGTSAGFPSPRGSSRGSHPSRQTSIKKSRKLPMTPELREPRSRPDSTTLSSLPPPALDLDELRVKKAASISNLSLIPPSQPEIIRLHRSATTASQEVLFEKQAFRNSAVLCDIRGTLVEYAQKTSSDEDSHDVGMVTASESCRILVVRKREPTIDSPSTIQTTTSIWTFSDDNTIRMQLRMSDGDVYVPYSSYFNPGKISITVPCELKYHDVKYGNRLLRTAKTNWINYVFDDPKSATLFQNELMGRTLLATFPTSKTMRIHEGFSGAFSYAEQMCGMENLRIWEDDETLAVVALIHFSAHFRNGYLAFYLNSSDCPIKVKDDGAREVKIKGLRVPLDVKEKGRKDSVVAAGGKDIDRKKFITGCKVEFESEEDKRGFLELIRDVQRELRELPALLGVN